jgi:hypothetical protein
LQLVELAVRADVKSDRRGRVKLAHIAAAQVAEDTAINDHGGALPLGLSGGFHRRYVDATSLARVDLEMRAAIADGDLDVAFVMADRKHLVFLRTVVATLKWEYGGYRNNCVI